MTLGAIEVESFPLTRWRIEGEDGVVAEIEIQRDRGRDRTVQIARGSLSLADAARGIEAAFADGPTRDILWDLSAASFDALKASDVARLAAIARRYVTQRPQGRTALVFSSDAGYGLGRMFETLQEIRSSPIQYRVFRSRAEAERWLDLPFEEQDESGAG